MFVCDSGRWKCFCFSSWMQFIHVVLEITYAILKLHTLWLTMFGAIYFFFLLLRSHNILKKYCPLFYSPWEVWLCIQSWMKYWIRYCKRSPIIWSPLFHSLQCTRLHCVRMSFIHILVTFLNYTVTK